MPSVSDCFEMVKNKICVLHVAGSSLLFLIENIVTTSKALVTRSDALVTSSEPCYY